MSISRDEMENIRWGQAMTWGSQKHPPLFGWIHYGWTELFGRADLSTYVLQKINFSAGLLLLWFLTRHLLGRDKALLCAALTLATANAFLISLKYNATSAMWPIWAGYLLCFWYAYERRNMAWWAATGVLAGLSILTKYHSLLLLACSFLFLSSHAEGRARLLGGGPRLAAAIALAMLAPHVVWLWRAGGATIVYAIDNVTEGARLDRHLVEPLRYVALQALCLLPALGLLLSWSRKGGASAALLDTKATIGRFLFWHGPVLGLLPAALSLLGGMSLGSLWGMTSWGLLPAWMVARFRIHSQGRLDTALAAATGLALLVTMAYFTNTIFFAHQQDYKSAAQAVEANWEERYDSPLTIVGGSQRYHEGLGVYVDSRPDVFDGLEPTGHPDIDMARIRREGAVLVVPELSDDAARAYHERFEVDETLVLELPARRDGIRRTRPERLLVMFVAPEAESAREHPAKAGR